MPNLNKLSREEFKKLTETLIGIEIFAPSDDDLALIQKAEKLGYVENNEYTKAGYDALIYCHHKTLASASFKTQDGYTLERTLDNQACWTDGDMIFDVDEYTGLPMDSTEEALEGKLTVKLPINIEIDGESLDLQAVIQKTVDWNEHHFPQWALVIDESTELKLNKYTNKAFLTELLSNFALPDTGLSGEIELTNDDITYQGQYTVTSIDAGLEELLGFASEQSNALTI